MRTLLLIFLLVPISAFATCEGSDALSLYKQGCIEEARSQFVADLDATRKSLLNMVPSFGKAKQWEALINIAWFEDEVGQHAKAIEYSNQALELANDMKDDFLIGRTLSWLGWAYSHQGLYELAEQFYLNALELAAPGGKIRHAMVWGFSKQELGALKFKMGNADEAVKLLDETYAYAKNQTIDIGIAEGGVHLAEISLVRGRLGPARTYANEAMAAAERCDCGPLKVSRAKLIAAKVAVEQSKSMPNLSAAAKQAVEEARAYAAKVSDPHSEAEAMIMLSHLEPGHDFALRYELAAGALEKLTNANSELRGLAEMEVGRTLAEDGQLDLAKFYLKNGVRIDNEMMRKVDKSFALTELGRIEGLKGNQREYLEKTESAYKTAKKSGAAVAEFENARTLALEYSQLGYSKLSFKYAKIALGVSDQMLKNETDAERRRMLSEQQLELAQIAGENAAEFTFGFDPPGN